MTEQDSGRMLKPYEDALYTCFALRWPEVFSRSRRRWYLYPRYCIIRAINELEGMTYGGMERIIPLDRCTIYNALWQADTLYKMDADFRDTYKEFKVQVELGKLKSSINQ